MSDKRKLEELSVRLERYSPNDYFDYMPDENTENNNNNTTTANHNASSAANLTTQEADSSGLLALLTEWDLVCLYGPCTDQLVDVELLKYITPAQCNILSAEFPLGIRIKFVAKVMQWRGY